ncbi:PspC domain-containing protein [Shewanella psychrotolerans]|uniref:PspC domain-containing protein n=1 Tax=Shewanella psychrotolerans TaxID=2864206 RepID=UPI001C65B0C8|nr:PspC domain-containing protein [Shewanella psychrotolerans]QYK00985.1 PspC domain-containing protein [Shewanella psychrotolerans]
MNIDNLVRRLKRPKGVVCGIAAMMADKFGWSRLWTRVVWAIAVIMNPAISLLVYFALALVLPKWDPQY